MKKRQGQHFSGHVLRSQFLYYFDKCDSHNDLVTESFDLLNKSYSGYDTYCI